MLREFTIILILHKYIFFKKPLLETQQAKGLFEHCLLSQNYGMCVYVCCLRDV